MISAALARELRCEVRTFRNVQHAMRWYWRGHLADYSPDGPRPINSASSCISDEQRERDNATSVLIGCCLEEDDPEVDHFHLYYAKLFLAWCCSFDNQRDLADEQGMTLSELRRTMKYTETVIARRMRVRRLLR